MKNSVACRRRIEVDREALLLGIISELIASMLRVAKALETIRRVDALMSLSAKSKLKKSKGKR